MFPIEGTASHDATPNRARPLRPTHAEGAALLDRAIAANPNCAEAYFRGSWMSIWNGDFAIALSRADISERLDPLSAEEVARTGIRAAARFFLREFDAAIEAADRTIGRRRASPSQPALL